MTYTLPPWFTPVSGRDHFGEKIKAAAIMSTDGLVHSVPAPGRHMDVMIHMVDNLGYQRPIKQENLQGFVTEDDVFLDRVQAHRVASQAKQILPGRGARRELYSEDLW